MKYKNIHTGSVVEVVSQFEQKYWGTVYVLADGERWESKLFHENFAKLQDETGVKETLENA